MSTANVDEVVQQMLCGVQEPGVWERKMFRREELIRRKWSDRKQFMDLSEREVKQINEVYKKRNAQESHRGRMP